MQRREDQHGWGATRLSLLVAVLVGICIGVSAYTFQYGEGLSYFSTDPKACVNCHIMRPQYDSWQKASHHAVATCVDCHLPHDVLGKYLAKADNGYRHSKAFTLQDFHEPIMITPKNARILQQNCVECHQGLVHTLVPGARTGPDFVSCTHCHLDAGHGVPTGLGGPDRGETAERNHP